MKYTSAGKIFAFMESVSKARTRTLGKLYNFLETELGIEDARKIAFHRLHRVGKEKRNPREPRAIIASFLRYPEAVFSRHLSLEDESGFGIGPYLPKQVEEMSKKLIRKMLEARSKERGLLLGDLSHTSS